MLDHGAEAATPAERLRVGNGGWVQCQASAAPELVIYRRYVDREGRLEAVATYIETITDGGLPLDADLLRSIRFGHIDSWVNANGDLVRDRLELPGPDLRRAARHYASTFGFAPGSHWVHDMLWAQVPTSELPQAPLPKVAPLAMRLLPAIDAKLKVPAQRPFGDEFYRDVATLYRELAVRTRAVASVIADANRVEVTQVHRWVKVARAKGFLPRGRRGKVG